MTVLGNQGQARGCGRVHAVPVFLPPTTRKPERRAFFAAVGTIVSTADMIERLFNQPEPHWMDAWKHKIILSKGAGARSSGAMLTRLTKGEKQLGY